jgi:ankyrin repeat protein
MSFLSFYNDQHGKEGEAVINLINKESWEDAEFVSKTDPLAVCWKVIIPGFYDGTVSSKVLPIHIACKKRPPVSMITTLHDIHPRGFLTAESAYKRLPLHIACMHNAPTETIVKIIQLKGGAAKKKDALGRIPIHYAAKDPGMDVVIAHLLKVYPGSTKVADKQGFLPIHVACRCGMSVAVISLLLQAAPGTINKKTKKGSTPYMCARQMKGSHKKEVILLLQRLAEPGKTD